MRAIMTVTGKDNKGIIAKVSTFLAEKGANVEEVSQTILGDCFAMIMLVDMSDAREELSSVAKTVRRAREQDRHEHPPAA